MKPDTFLESKQRSEVRLESAPGFPKMSDTHYFDRLRELHRSRRPVTYFEIGTESGASLALAKCHSIAVDPKFKLDLDIVDGKPSLQLYQTTSDEFFQSNVLGTALRPIDLAFLDGLHLFEVLLRDFIGTERHMDPDGMVVLHDCVPINHKMTNRSWDRRVTRQWTGDVWKIVPILREYRPDLVIDVRPFAPTGLVEITNLDPTSRLLEEKYDEIIERYLPLELKDDGLERWKAGLQLAPLAQRAVPAAPVRKADLPEIVIQTPVPRPRGQSLWGDTHFANALSAAFDRAGYKSRVQTKKHWPVRASDNEVDIVIKGSARYEPREGVPSIYWVLYFDDFGDLATEVSRADHVFAAGKPLESELRQVLKDETRVSLLPQAVDAKAAPEPGQKERKYGLTFAGLNRRGGRPIVNWAMQSGFHVDLWGRNWERAGVGDIVHALNIDPRELLEVYGASEIVLNDHRPEMLSYGIPSNRIFDALAVGVPVITDSVAWIPDEFRDFVEFAQDKASFVAAVERIRSEDESRRLERQEFAAAVRERHSFDSRAREILKMVQKISTKARQKETA